MPRGISMHGIGKIWTERDGNQNITLESVKQIYLTKRGIARQQPHCEMRVPTGERYGGTSEFELAYLAKLAHRAEGEFAANNIIVEIGSMVGKSVIPVASVTTRDIVAIDPHEGDWEEPALAYIGIDGVEEGYINRREIMGDTYDQMVENLEYYGYRDRVEILKMMSDQAAKEWDGRKICFMFIDGDHHEKWVRHDVEAFAPWLVPQAMLVFHDYKTSCFGVTKVVDELVEEGVIHHGGTVGSMFYARYLG
jgi:hypothetical protein